MGKLQTITFLVHQGVSFVLRLRQSFPEDCARLKLSSARASQAGLKEMMMQTKSEGISERDNPGKRRPPVLLVCHGAMRMGKLQTLL